MKDEIISDLHSAMFLISQAQEKIFGGTPLFKDLGGLYDELDNIVEGVTQGDYEL
jgi:hypothetical protein